MITVNHRVVLDTNEVISAGSSWLLYGVPSPDKNPSRRILLSVAASYSGKFVGEYFEKLIDLGHPTERAVKLMAYITGAFTKITITTVYAPFKPTDPDDEVFLLCAIDGNADFLISNDHSLLNLKSSYAKPTIGNSKDLIAEFCPEV